MVLAELGGKLRESLRKLHAASASGLDTKVLDTLLSEISRALIESDVNVRLVMTLRNNIKNRVAESFRHHEENGGGTTSAQNLVKLVQKSVTDELITLLSPENTKPYAMKKNKPNVILFVGLQGAGKTTTIAKYANYYQRRGWKTAMVCADTFRAGAFDQLKQNATKLRIPFYGSYVVADPVEIAEEGVSRFVKEKYEVIIVDTSGRHKQESALFDEMREISSAVRADNIIFVMDATQGQAVYDQAFAFKEAVEVGSVIVTKLDGHAKGGGAISAVAATKSPIIFTGSGEKFDDFDAFNAQSFVSKLLGWGDLTGFLDEIKAMSSSEPHMDLMERFSKGQPYTLRDMYKQLQSMMKMGPMSKMMEMMPGMDSIAPFFAGEDGHKLFKTLLYIMDSMTDDELDGKVDWHNKKGIDTSIESRVLRISRGSGTHPKEVKLVLRYHKYFEKMIKMSQSAGSPSQQKQIAEQMKKNPNAMLNRMNPQMLQQLGGRDAVLNMMQQMKGGPGAGMPPGSGMPMPDMTAMSRMMQQMGLGGRQMPDSNTFAQMMQQMGGMAGAGSRR